MNPTYQHYATHDESEFPHLWRGVVGSWAPCLGPSGTRLHDHSGRANWGTLTNMDPATDWVVDGGQYALDFDGVNDVITMTPGIITGTTPFTMSAWCRLNAAPNFFQGVLMMGGGGVGNSAYVGWVSGAQVGTSNSWGGGGFGRNYGSGITDITGWHHVVLTSSGGASQAFSISVDGRQLATGNETISLTATHLRIGANPTDAFTNGKVDDCVIWDRDLKQNQIAELYQIGRGGMYTPRRRRRAYSFGPSFFAAWSRGSNVLLQPCGVS